jgi:hypothetical protein
MVKERLAADVDFSGVESLFIADMQMKDKFFPCERWFTDRIFCAPVDVCEQLEKLDSMISRDVEQTAIHLIEKDKFLRRLEKKETLLYIFSVESNRWTPINVFLKKEKYTKDGIIWLVFVVATTLLITRPCYSTVAAAFRNGVAPW